MGEVMKELKSILLILITLAVLISAGFYCWSIYQEQTSYSQKQECIAKHYSFLKEKGLFEEEDVSKIDILKYLSEYCDYLPDSLPNSAE